MAVLSLLATNLRAARRAADLSQDEAAEAIGIRKQTVSDHERGIFAPSDETLGKYAKLYRVLESELRYGAVPRPLFTPLSGRANRVAEPTTSALPKPAKVYIDEMLLELRHADVSDQEIDDARRLLTSPEMYRFWTGGEPNEFSEKELMMNVKAACGVIIDTLKERGYKLKKR